jgi:hypothetical protein
MKKQVESNPFTADFVIEASEIRHSGLAVSIIERNRPMSVWSNGAVLKAIVQFSPSAKDMIFYIINHLGEATDTIEIEYERYKVKTGLDISLRTFQRAILELTNKIIADRPARKNTYWVNPAVLYRGNRIRNYPTHVDITYVDPNIVLLREKKILKPRKPLNKLFTDDEE